MMDTQQRDDQREEGREADRQTDRQRAKWYQNKHNTFFSIEHHPISISGRSCQMLHKLSKFKIMHTHTNANPSHCQTHTWPPRQPTIQLSNALSNKDKTLGDNTNMYCSQQWELTGKLLNCK